jgi:glycosyltransferase involved in cell wall biosynthesis
MESLPRNTRILFATFSAWVSGKRLPTNGSLDPLREYLIPHINKLVIIDQVIPGSDNVLPRIEVYSSGKLKRIASNSLLVMVLQPLLSMGNKPGTRIIFKVRDFLSVIDWCLRKRKKYDYFIGMESINALAGILLRRFGFLDRVVYYVSDYSPNRYKNQLFNKLYLWLDRIAATHSDYIWDVSKAMMPARIEAGLDAKYADKVIHVPNGLYKDQILPQLEKPKLHSIVFMGTLGKENGSDLIIKALPAIIKKYPHTRYHIIGGTKRDIERLKAFARKENVAKYVIFHGFVLKTKDMTDILKYCTVAVAPYRAIPGSPRYYADAGKIRIYAAAGVPIICSDVPPLGREMAEIGGAVVVSDTAEAFAEAILDLFGNRQKRDQLRKNAYNYAKESTWERTLSRAFEQMSA